MRTHVPCGHHFDFYLFLSWSRAGGANFLTTQNCPAVIIPAWDVSIDTPFWSRRESFWVSALGGVLLVNGLLIRGSEIPGSTTRPQTDVLWVCLYLKSTVIGGTQGNRVFAVFCLKLEVGLYFYFYCYYDTLWKLQVICNNWIFNHVLLYILGELLFCSRC